MIVDKIDSGWKCSECGGELYWGEGVVLISAGTIDKQNDGPTVDSNAWWGIYHHDCYGDNK